MSYVAHPPDHWNCALLVKNLCALRSTITHDDFGRRLDATLGLLERMANIRDPGHYLELDDLVQPLITDMQRVSLPVQSLLDVASAVHSIRPVV